MSADIASMKQSLVRLRQERAELETIRKEAFMAAPPMPGGGMPPGMDPSMMQGGMPPQGMPVDPNTGMPMDPSMMQGGGMPPQGMPPGMDPSMMQGGMPPQGMPPQGMPPGMDPSMMQGGAPQQPPAPPITPEMLDEIIGVVEQLAAGSEQHEKEMQGMKQQLEEVMSRFDELEQRLAQMFSGPQQGM